MRNVYYRPIDGQGKGVRLTDFTEDHVFQLSVSADGSTAVFRQLFDFWRLDLRTPGTKPVPIRLVPEAGVEARPATRRRWYNTAWDGDEAGEVAFAPDGKTFAFTAGGDLYVMDSELREPKLVHGGSLTHVRGCVFSPGVTNLYYVSERGDGSDLWRVERADPKKVIILGGCDNPAQAYATLGYRVIGGPYEYCYFDFEQNAPDDPCVYASWWPGTVAVNTVCGFIPDLGIPDRFKKNVIGGVGYTWSEFTYTRAEFEWKLWPRAIALAQALWHPIEGFDCNSQFLPAVRKHVEQLRREGVNAASLPTRSQQALW